MPGLPRRGPTAAEGLHAKELLTVKANWTVSLPFEGGGEERKPAQKIKLHIPTEA